MNDSAIDTRQGLTSVPVYFCTEMVADAESYSPSAAKPAWVVDAWQASAFPIDVRRPEAATRKDFKLAHDPQLVDDILDLRADNGFGNRLSSIAESLPYTTGAMHDAAREALTNGIGAVAPVAGFHHAGYASIGGYCTFNGLVITAMNLQQNRIAKRIAILDFDQHFGDGTHDCITALGLDWISHFSAGRHYRHRDQAPEFLASIPSLISQLLPADLLLYQAGADPHVDDPLGGWLTTGELRQRDETVFRACRTLRLPVAWNLAGGYQRERERIIEIHVNTMAACAAHWLD